MTQAGLVAELNKSLRAKKVSRQVKAGGNKHKLELSVRACVRACVREIEHKPAKSCVCLHVGVSVCVCVCVSVCVFVGGSVGVFGC